jgi:hypothetical protein
MCVQLRFLVGEKAPPLEGRGPCGDGRTGQWHWAALLTLGTGGRDAHAAHAPPCERAPSPAAASRPPARGFFRQNCCGLCVDRSRRSTTHAHSIYILAYRPQSPSPPVADRLRVSARCSLRERLSSQLLTAGSSCQLKSDEELLNSSASEAEMEARISDGSSARRRRRHTERRVAARGAPATSDQRLEDCQVRWRRGGPPVNDDARSDRHRVAQHRMHTHTPVSPCFLLTCLSPCRPPDHSLHDSRLTP